MKRIVVVLLAVLMIVGAMPVQVWATGVLPSNDPQVEMGNGVVASGNCGYEGSEDSVKWSLDSDGTLTISGTGKMGDWGWNDVPWYNWEMEIEIKNVVIQSGVTSIGNCAFSNFLSLENVTIPDSVTSIGEYAFRRCFALEKVFLGNNVTSIGEGAFQYCSALTSMRIPDGVPFISAFTFESCSSLKSVEIPDSVTSIGMGAFSSCTGLTSVTIPDSVTTIERNAFSNCSSLENLTLPDSVTTIGSNAFSGCSSLENLTIPNSVTSIGMGAFYFCTELTSVTIPDSVTVIEESTFWNCTSLKSLTIPKSVTTIEDYSIGYKYESGDLYPIPGFTIYGYTGSAAETYATKWGIDFVSIGVVETEPDTPEPTPDTPEPTPDTPEPTPSTPEPTPGTPEPTPDAPEPTPSTPEPTPDAPETTPDTPETTPDTPETPPVQAEAVHPLPNGLEILVTEVPETEKAKMESAVDTMLPAADDMKVVYVDISLVETASQDEKHDQSVTVLIGYPAEIGGAWRNYTYTVIHGAVQSDGSITPEIVRVTATADGLVYQGSLSPFAVIYQPKKTVPGIGGSSSVSGSPNWNGTGTASNPLATPTGPDNVAAAIALLGVAAAALSAGAARVRKRK